MLDERQRIVSGQVVTPSKLAFARKLRREMTPQERTLWERLRDKRLGGWKFRRQQVIDGYIADFFCATAGVVLELDGAVHDDQEEYDAHRDRALAARRLIVRRIPNDRIERELETVLAEVVAECEVRRPHPPRPPPHEWRGGVQRGVVAATPRSRLKRLSGTSTAMSC